MLSAIGKLLYTLKIGGSRKDAITNAASLLLALSIAIEECARNGLVPAQYQSWAYGLIAIAGGVIGIATGKAPDLKTAETPKEFK